MRFDSIFAMVLATLHQALRHLGVPGQLFDAPKKTKDIAVGCLQFNSSNMLQSARVNLVVVSAKLMIVLNQNLVLKPTCLLQQIFVAMAGLLHSSARRGRPLGNTAEKPALEAAGTRVDQWLKKAIKKPLKSILKRPTDTRIKFGKFNI